MADFDIAVKTYVEKRLERAANTATPFLALALKNSTNDASGKGLEWFIQKDTMEDLAQAAGMSTPIEAYRKNILLPASMPWKYTRASTYITMQEHDMSRGQNWGPDFVATVGDALVFGFMKRISRMLLGLDGMSSDGGLMIQSVIQALKQDQTYAGITRSGATVNPLCQSASLDRTFTDQDTQVRMSVDLLDEIGLATRRYRTEDEGEQKLVHFCGEELYLTTKRELRSYVGYKGEGSLTKLGFGFKSFMVDDNEIVLAQELYDANYKGTDAVYPSRWLISVDPSVLAFKFAPDHPVKAGHDNGKMWKSQNDHTGGTATYLGLVDAFGAFAVKNPNRCCLKTNVRSA